MVAEATDTEAGVAGFKEAGAVGAGDAQFIAAAIRAKARLLDVSVHERVAEIGVHDEGRLEGIRAGQSAAPGGAKAFARIAESDGRATDITEGRRCGEIEAQPAQTGEAGPAVVDVVVELRVDGTAVKGSLTEREVILSGYGAGSRIVLLRQPLHQESRGGVDTARRNDVASEGLTALAIGFARERVIDRERGG